MEIIISAIVGAAVVFLCLFCYRQGLKDGRCVKENKPLDKIVSSSEKEKPPDEFAKQYAEFMAYQPLEEVRHIES